MINRLRAIGIALLFLASALGITLLFAATVAGVPAGAIPRLALVLAGAGGGIGLCGMLLTRPAVLRRFGSVRSQLVGVGLVGNLLLVGTVVAGATAMFISLRDLWILLPMLLFASLLAFGLSLRGASPLGRHIDRIRTGTARLAGGEFETELPVEGHDEVADLARDFNRMVVRLREMTERERGLERARRDLIASVSHDLRTPLAATLALVEAVADNVAPDPQTEARYLSSARRELANLGRLVSDLFELVQIDAGVLRPNLEPASLHDLISDTLASFQPQAQLGGVRLIGEAPENVDPVLMDLPRLGRVLQNLISNSLRYTPAGGAVSVRTELQGELVRVEIADTGRGISPVDLPHIFERSFRGEKPWTRPQEEGIAGTGLGLAIAQGLVEAHGSTISVESEIGEGTRFHFILRRA